MELDISKDAQKWKTGIMITITNERDIRLATDRKGENSMPVSCN